MYLRCIKHYTVVHQMHAPMISCRFCAVYVYKFFSLCYSFMCCENKRNDGKMGCEKWTVKNAETFAMTFFFVIFEIMGCLLIYKQIMGCLIKQWCKFQENCFVGF